MIERRHSALRFHHPDLDRGGIEPGLRLSPTGELALVEGNDSIRQAILLLLSTLPGERVMRPEYGCDLRRLLFSPNDDTTAGLAAHYVRRAVTFWEPRVELLSVDAGSDDQDAGRLIVYLQYRVVQTGNVESMQYSLNLAEGTD